MDIFLINKKTLNSIKRGKKPLLLPFFALYDILDQE